MFDVGFEIVNINPPPPTRKQSDVSRLKQNKCKLRERPSTGSFRRGTLFQKIKLFVTCKIKEP